MYFVLGEFDKSLADCDVVLRLNPDHFGALTGAAQHDLPPSRTRPQDAA